MSILIDKNTRVMCQGITGKAGTVPQQGVPGIRHQDGRRSHAGEKEAKKIDGLPVFDTVEHKRSPRRAPTRP